jgi:hypothetical protein
MDQRRRAAVLASSGAVIAASSTLLLSSSRAGPSADFLREFAIGLALVFIAFAGVLIARGRDKSCG